MLGSGFLGTDGRGGGGFRAAALALVLSLLASFLWSSAQAAGPAVADPAATHASALVDGGDGLDSFFLPRPVTLETSRHALATPPAPPAPDVAAVDLMPALPVPPRASSTGIAPAPAETAGRGGPRTPTGPPAA